MTEKQKRKMIKTIAKAFIDEKTVWINGLPVVWFDAKASNKLKYDGKRFWLDHGHIFEPIAVYIPLWAVETVRVAGKETVTYKERR